MKKSDIVVGGVYLNSPTLVKFHSERQVIDEGEQYLPYAGCNDADCLLVRHVGGRRPHGVAWVNDTDFHITRTAFARWACVKIRNEGRH